MTCVVMYLSANNLIVASDYRDGSSEMNLALRKHRSFKLNDMTFVLATSGRGRPAQILLYELPNKVSSSSSEKLRDLSELYRWAITTVIPQVREIATNHKFYIRREGHESFQAGLIIGCRLGICTINMAGMVRLEKYPFDAIGSGADAALGCLHTLEHIDDNSMTPQQKVGLAMRVAHKINLDSVSETFALDTYNIT